MTIERMMQLLGRVTAVGKAHATADELIINTDHDIYQLTGNSPEELLESATCLRDAYTLSERQIMEFDNEDECTTRVAQARETAAIFEIVENWAEDLQQVVS